MNPLTWESEVKGISNILAKLVKKKKAYSKRHLTRATYSRLNGQLPHNLNLCTPVFLGSVPAGSASQQKATKSLSSQEHCWEDQRGSQVSPTERMAKLKLKHQSANSGNLSKVAITCNVEKVKTMRCFWEMKFEPEVSPQEQICSISIFSISESPAGGSKTLILLCFIYRLNLHILYTAHSHPRTNIYFHYDYCCHAKNILNKNSWNGSPLHHLRCANNPKLMQQLKALIKDAIFFVLHATAKIFTWAVWAARPPTHQERDRDCTWQSYRWNQGRPWVLQTCRT